MFHAAATLTQLFAAQNQCYHTFLGLLPWYEYLDVKVINNVCEVQNTALLGSHSLLLLVLAAVVEDLLRLAGIFSVIYTVYAGVKYIMSQGSPDETGKAQESLRNAIAGLIITIIAIPLTTYLAGRFAGGGAPKGSRILGLDLSSLPNPAGIDTGAIIPVLLSVAFNIIGGLSVLFVVIGGYNYVMSNGESTKAGKAKATILYALIGLTVANSIVAFVIGKLR
jgi:hypothetical protein